MISDCLQNDLVQNLKVAKRWLGMWVDFCNVEDVGQVEDENQFNRSGRHVFEINQDENENQSS